MLTEELPPDKARVTFNQKVIRSFDFLLRQCCNKIYSSAPFSINDFTPILDSEYLSPDIHYQHHSLQTAMRSQDVNSVKNILRQIRQHSSPQSDQNVLISTINNTDWENFVVSEALRMTRDECGEEAEILPLSDAELYKNSEYALQALRRIEEISPQLSKTIKTHTNVIKLFKGKTTMGFTDLRIMGAMMIRTPRTQIDPCLYFMEHIIHEASHMHLNCLMASDPIVLNPRTELFHSPLRNDMRPMFGVFHATYVSSIIANFFLKLSLQYPRDSIIHTLAEASDETMVGIKEIEKHADLTDFGWKLVDQMNKVIQTILNSSYWEDFDFNKVKTHRFGVGTPGFHSFISRLHEDRH